MALSIKQTIVWGFTIRPIAISLHQLPAHFVPLMFCVQHTTHVHSALTVLKHTVHKQHLTLHQLCYKWFQGVHWLRRLVARVSSDRPGFNTTAVQVRFVVDKFTLRLFYLRVLYFNTSVALWLRCCAVCIGSISAGVIGIFFDMKSFRSHYGPGVDSASNRCEYQEHFLGVKAAGA